MTRFMALQEVAEALGVDVQTVRRWIHDGKLRAFKPGKEYRVREADLEEFLQAREVRPKDVAPPLRVEERRESYALEPFEARRATVDIEEFRRLAERYGIPQQEVEQFLAS